MFILFYFIFFNKLVCGEGFEGIWKGPHLLKKFPKILRLMFLYYK